MQAPECRLDVGSEEVEVELLGVEMVESQSFPPGASRGVQGRDDDCSAGGFLVELCGRGEHVPCERGADPEAGVAVVDGEPGEEQRWDGIGGSFGKCLGRGRAVDSGHRDAGVCHNNVGCVGDDPGGCGVAAAVLAGVAAQPLIEHGRAAVELLAVVPANVEQCGATELSQAS